MPEDPMKINPAFLALMTLSLLASGWAVERTTTLQVETRLYGATGLRERRLPSHPPSRTSSSSPGSSSPDSAGMPPRRSRL